jgi:putative DNA primase/helicase
MTADVSVQELPVWHGGGGNGKSLILDTVMGTMGDYADVAPDSLITVRRNEEHPTEIADLQGKRFIVASETESGASLRLQLIKKFTGDAKLKGRKMRCDLVSFVRTFKIVIVSNHPPQVKENTEAAWRRLRLVPFTVTIPEHERDEHLLKKLEAERPGILKWMMDGCLAWQAEKLGAPPEVMAATKNYQADQDAVGNFIAEYCVQGQRLWCYATELFKKFKDSQEAAGESAGSQKAFGSELGKRGYRGGDRCSYTGRAIWRGIGLKTGPNPSDPSEGSAHPSGMEDYDNTDVNA